MKNNSYGSILISVFTGLLLSSFSLLAQQEVSSCLDIQSDIQRLQCYDRSLNFIKAPPENNQINSSPLHETADTNSETATNNPAITANKNVAVSERETGQARVIIAATKDKFRGWKIEFENGEKWQQIGSDYFNIEVGERYSIIPGSFDSYFLTNINGRSRIRVTQVQ